MNWEQTQSIWRETFQKAPLQLEKMRDIKGVISAFNANIDAVIKIDSSRFSKLLSKIETQPSHLLESGAKRIACPEDLLRGFISCFKEGKAEEWLIQDEETFKWIQANVGHDKYQMGGQGGIIANAMAVCGVPNVFVHCASLPQEQAKLFLNMPSIQSANEKGDLIAVQKIARQDLPLIHWILEFDHSESIQIGQETIICPKSNRFIATYDPKNFELFLDPSFIKAMQRAEHDVVVLSGYHMLQTQIPGGGRGTERIDASLEYLKEWKRKNPSSIQHLEVASTQDIEIRKKIINSVAKEMDSLGLNERETIDVLEVIGENALAQECEKRTDSVNLFQGIQKIFEYTDVSRIQLHMFGLYLTIQKKNFKLTPLQNKNGMALAATIAATKAGTGDIDTPEKLLWSKTKDVSPIGLKELHNLQKYLTEKFGDNNILTSGVFETGQFDIIAVPTIIIDKPITLVGMGDTISSISLVGAR